MYTEKKEKLHVVYNVYDVFVFLGGDINSTMLGGNIFFGMKLATIKTKNQRNKKDVQVLCCTR